MTRRRFYWWSFLVLLSVLFLLLFVIFRRQPEISVTREVEAREPTPAAQQAPMNPENVTWAREIAVKAFEPVTISDMREIWQNNANAYIQELDAQTVREMLMNQAETAFEWIPIQNGENFSDYNTDIIRLLLKTRRFNQALETVIGQDEPDRGKLADDICAVMQRLLQDSESLAKDIEALDEFTPAGQDRLNLRLFGTTTASPFSAERYGLNGIGIGMAANCYLLGLCGESCHLPSLLDAGRPGLKFIGYGTRYAAYDAMDRIILRQRNNASLDSEARGIVDEYVAWREERRLPPRKLHKRFAHDSSGTPYSLGAAVGGLPVEMREEVELPYRPAFCSEGKTSLRWNILDDPERLAQENQFRENHGGSVLREDPSQGLTREDVKFITSQAQRLAATVEKR